MIRDSLSPPQQMGNGGSPPAHLPLSTAPDDYCFADFPLFAAKWMQPPARAPKWMREWTNGGIKRYTILGWGSPHHWIVRGRQEDLRFAVTVEHPRPRHDSPDEAAYQAWKCAVDNMWRIHAMLDEHHALIATRAKIETELARQARQQRSAARTIFLWLRRRRLHARLARQTSRRQLREAALARLRYEQECSERAALAETQRLAAAAARTTALADAAVEQRIREALANERRCHEADVQRLRDSLANERRRREADNSSANLALIERRRLVEERRHHEAAKQAAASAERALAEERCRHDASARAAASAELALAEERRAAESAERALAEERCRHDASARTAALAELSLVEEGRRHNTAAQAAELAALVLAEERPSP